MTLLQFPDRSSAVSVDVQTLEERHREWEVRPHGHAFFEVIVAEKGPVPYGVFAIPPGSIHDCREFGVEAGLAVRFLPDGVDSREANTLSIVSDIPTGLLFDVFRRPTLDLIAPFVIEAGTHAEVLSTLSRMRKELQQKARGYEFIVRGALSWVLVELARSIPSEPSSADEPKSREFLRRVFADIDAHFTDDDSLSSAADRLSLTAPYMTTRIRILTGRTYGDWLIERRMLEARRLLIVSDMQIAEIAQRVGYTESESFIRRFKERHRMTPAAWREKSRSIPT